MRELQELNGRIEAKLKRAREIMAAHPDYDWSEEEGEELKQLQAEINDMSKKRDDLAARANVAEAFKGLHTTENQLPANPFVHADPQEGQEGKGDQGDGPMLSLGQQFVNSLGFKSFDRGQLRGPSVDLQFYRNGQFPGEAQRKALVMSGVTAPRSVDTGLVVEPIYEPPAIIDLIPSIATTAAVVRYVERGAFTNVAAPTAEGALLPEGSVAASTPREENVRDIGAYFLTTEQALADETQIRAEIDAELPREIRDTENAQVLSGSGTAPNLRGILNRTGLLTRSVANNGAAPPVATEKSTDTIHRGLTQVFLATRLQPDGLVINPLDWERIKLMKDGNGNYMYGGPADPGPDRIWGLTPVQSQNVVEGTGLMGAFRAAARIYRRQEIEVAASTEDADNFKRRIVTIRATSRLALVVTRPSAFLRLTNLNIAGAN